MKKHWLKKAVSVVLAAAMVMGLSACGRGGDGGSGIRGGNVSQDPNLAKQYVYSYEEFELSDLGDDFRMYDLQKIGDRIYWAVSVYHWSDERSYSDLRLLSVKEDGTDLQMAELQLPESESGTDGEAEDAGTNDAAKSEQDTPEAADDTAQDTADVLDAGFGVAVPDIDIGMMDYNYVWENTSYNDFTFTETGTLYGIENYYYENRTDAVNAVIRSTTAVCAWDLQGNLLWKQELEVLGNNESIETPVNMGISSMITREDGSLLILVYNYDSNELVGWTMDGDGNLDMEGASLEDEDRIFMQSSYFVEGENGQLILVYYNEKDNYDLYAAQYDLNSGKFVGDGVKLPESISYTGFNSLMSGVDHDLVYSSSSGIYGYNLGDEESTQIMSFVNSDLDATSMQQFQMLDADHFIGFYYTPTDYVTKGALFTKVDPKDIPDKKVLVLAGQYVGWDLKRRIVEFNKTNPNYRIVIKEYEQYAATQDDYMGGYTQLNSDILSGNMPDIMIVDTNMNVANYVSKGLLANVGDLIKQDEELSQVEFMQNVFDAYSVNGKLYEVIPTFYVRTFVGKRSLVGDRTKWNMKEYLEVLSSMPEGTQGIEDMYQSYFMSNMMTYCGSDFVDVSTGKCDFDSENFISLLEYAGTLPEEPQYDEDYWMHYQTMFRENKILLTSTAVLGSSNMTWLINGQFGEDVSFVGFPTDSELGGSIIWKNTSYVLSAQSANLEGAWEFVRYYLTDEYQNEQNGYLPVNVRAFDEAMAATMKRPTYEDENGELVEYDDYYYLGEEQITLPPLTQEQADQISGFIRSVKKPYYYNADVVNIINEEAAAFFSGQKTAQDVAKIIQSRVQIYVNENQ
ncbi:MAG: extracellular solute-binding protein [Acetatifactor sp.]|nr:extracellular solute-binding protein [Acetatifactor sp.]